MITDILEKISTLNDLTPDEAKYAMNEIVQGKVSSEQSAAFLFGMRTKGETVQELTAFVEIMRAEAIPVEADTLGAVDLCGTGGDNSGTFNISTAAMFVVAGAGVPVLKHGNKSVSSKSGSFDVLKSLGAIPDLEKSKVEKLFENTGMAFMFAPNFHPAMKHIMPARRSLKMRTFFNMLGPLLNPARVKCQIIGAFSREAAADMIQILANLETEHAYTLSAHDGLDEISVTSQTEIFELKSHISGNSTTFHPQSLGYELSDPKDLLGGDAEVNAEIIKAIFNNRAKQAQKDIVQINAAFAIHAAGAADTLEDANELAVQSIESGQAKMKLEQFVKESQKLAGYNDA